MATPSEPNIVRQVLRQINLFSFTLTGLNYKSDLQLCLSVAVTYSVSVPERRFVPSQKQTQTHPDKHPDPPPSPTHTRTHSRSLKR